MKIFIIIMEAGANLPVYMSKFPKSLQPSSNPNFQVSKSPTCEIIVKVYNRCMVFPEVWTVRVGV